MKNRIGILAVTAAVLMTLGLGVDRADASGSHFSIGVNLGVPVVGAYLPPPAPVVVYPPVRYYGPATVYYDNYYGYRYGGHRHWHSDRYHHYYGHHNNNGWHRGGHGRGRGNWR